MAHHSIVLSCSSNHQSHVPTPKSCSTAQCSPEVAAVIFLHFDSAPVPKFLNSDGGSGIFQNWESDSCLDSGYHRPNRNLPMFLLEKWPRRLLLLPKLKSGSGSRTGFPQIFYSGARSDRKTQNPAGVDSGTSDPCPLLVLTDWPLVLSD